MSGPSDNPTAGVLAPPPLIFGVPLVGGLLLSRWFPWPIVPDHLAAVVGIPLIMLGAVAALALLAFVRAGTRAEPWHPSTALVTDGPYRFSRNPMYLGMALVYLGVTVWTNVMWPLLVLPVVLGVMRYGVIGREERYLERRFGEAYHTYRRQVRRWL